MGLVDGQRLRPRERRRLRSVRHVHALAAGVVAEAVERAAERLADHPAAISEMGSQVRTVGVKRAHDAGLRAEEHDVPASECERPNATRFQIA